MFKPTDQAHNDAHVTETVLLPESGQPEGSLGRTVLAKELRIADEGHTRDLYAKARRAQCTSQHIAAGCGRPLLYTLVGRAKQLNPPVTPNPIAHVAEPKWAGGKLERTGE